MPKILILTAGYGEGHNSAAHALKSAFDEQPGVEAELVDLFALRAPRLNQLSRCGYLKLINTAPKIWSRLYQWLDQSPARRRCCARSPVTGLSSASSSPRNSRSRSFPPTPSTPG
ncbi:MAG: hypothetical protein WDM96_15860 [Lacunisphaera sp.]